MNAPLALPQIVDVADLSLPPPARPSPADAHDAAAGAARLDAAIDRLAAMLAGARGVAPAGDLTRLFCALCLMCGTNFNVRQLAAALPATAAPIDTNALLSAMANLGFHATRQRRRAAHLDPARLPLLFLPARGAPSVLFACPDTGRTRIAGACGASAFLNERQGLPRGVSWSFARNEEHPLDAARRAHTGHSWFRAMMEVFSRAGMALILLSFATAVVGVMLPLFTIQTYAQVISLGSAAPLPDFVIGMLIVIAIEAALLARRSQILAFTANRIEYLLGTLTFDRLLKIRASLSERAAVTDQAARLRTVENVRDFVTGPAFIALLEAPAALAAIAVIALLAGWVAVVPLAGIAIHLLIFAKMRARTRVLTSIAADESTEMQRITIETFEKREAIREAGLQHVWSDRMIGCARRQQRAQTRLRMVGALAESLSTLALMAGTMLLLVTGTDAVWTGAIGPGGLLAIIILGLKALAPFHSACLSVGRFEQLRSSVQQLNQVMDIPPERDPARTYVELKAVRGAVSFLNAGFRAGDTRPVFVGLDIEIEPGDVVAITGANGSGKSTVLKLVMALSELSMGALRIDGVDQRQLPVDDLRRRIAYLPQQPRLFPGTLRQNLLFARQMATPQRLRDALAVAGLTEAIDALPLGLDQVVSAAEIAALPSEFLFRFSLAQAMLVESKLLLVDEIPNALLDGEVGALMRRLIATNAKRRTIVFVTHRSDYLELADRVIALRYGKVPVITTPAKLLARLE